MTDTARVQPRRRSPTLLRELRAQAAVIPHPLLVATVCSLVALAASLLVPALSSRVVEQVTEGQHWQLAVVSLAVTLTLRSAADAVGTLARVQGASTLTVALRAGVLRNAFRLHGTSRHFEAGDLVSRITANAGLAGGLSVTVVGAVTSCAASVGGVVGLTVIDWRLGMVFVAGLIPAGAVLRALTSRASDAHSAYLTVVGSIAARLTDALVGWRTIRASGTASREIARILEPLSELSERGRAAWRVRQSGSWQLDLVQTALSIVTLGVAGAAVAQGRLSAGAFLAAYLYLTLALDIFDQPDQWFRLGDAWAHTRRVLELNDAPRAAPPVAASPPPRRNQADDALLPAVSFAGVTVLRKDRVILNDLWLDIPRGATLALVGRSGAGKTSLARLVGRLERPTAGRVLLHGTPVEAMDVRQLRREVSYAFERPHLLGQTLREALTFGRPEASHAEVTAAARAADVEGFVKRLPRGFDTPVPEAPLSGGERQRLGLARALVQGGSVLVLDDAMSSVDTVTEARITAALTRHSTGTTRLVVAHRARTAAQADQVAWLDGGRIRAVGTHRELWSGTPAYRALFQPEPEREGGR